MARRKNGRFTRQTKTRSRRKKTFNISKAAETALVANAAIGGMFGTNLPTFITGKKVGKGFGPNDQNNSWELTLPEMFNMLMGGTGGMSKDWQQRGFVEAVQRNIKANGLTAAGQMIGIPIAFKIGRKVLSKPLINPTNRALRDMGLKEVKL